MESSRYRDIALASLVVVALAAARLQPGETVCDIGCGDGRIVYLAVKDYGVKGTGFELSPLVYLLAKVRQVLWRSGARTSPART